MTDKQRTPQKDEVWADPLAELEVTVLWDAETGGGRVAYWWKFEGQRRVWSLPLETFLRGFTPKPEPTPGPDEVFVVIRNSDDWAFYAYSTREKAAENYNAAIVRYVKADPQ